MPRSPSPTAGTNLPSTKRRRRKRNPCWFHYHARDCRSYGRGARCALIYDGKACNLRVKDTNRKRVPIDGDALCQRTRNLYKHLGEGPPETSHLLPASAAAHTGEQLWTRKDPTSWRAGEAHPQGFPHGKRLPRFHISHGARVINRTVPQLCTCGKNTGLEGCGAVHSPGHPHVPPVLQVP